tara:strand:+ start:17063 stop:18508 length:1446 start_codon:yes stop_codon:yes gene_type:complete
VKTIKINENRPTEHLRKLALQMDADFEEGFGASSLQLKDNRYGEGYINLYEPFPGMNVRTYNLILKEELSLSLTEHGYSPLYLIFCIEGSYRHRYASEKQEKTVSQGRNLISLSSKNEEHLLTLPANRPIKLSVIVLLRKNLDHQSRGNLVSVIRDIVMKMDEGESYQFIGGLKNNIERHAKILVENRRTDLAGKLITEAATYATLAAQLDDHDNENKANELDVSDSELDRVVKLCSYISQNLERPHTIRELAHKSGLYPKKLQDAFQYLFNESVATCIKNMKLEKSKVLLETTDMSISSICDQIGINSKSYYSKIFKEKYGSLPKDYRFSFNKSENTFELTYKSKAQLYLSDTEVAELVANSDSANKKLGITGCLIHFGDEFFQLIEGPKSNVLKLFEKINDDNRHTNIELLWKGVRKERVFDDWGLILISDRRGFEDHSYSHDLNIGMKSLVQGDAKIAIRDLRFWQRMRHLIIDRMTD